MVEKSHAFRNMERVMEGKAQYRGAKANAMGMGCGFRKDHVRRRHGLPTAGVVFTDEKFIEVQLIGVMNQGNVTVKSQRRIFGRVVQRHHKKREFHEESLFV
jgi:hypothetical protein